MPNRLAHETSPYLLQHANNPVDWYPWGPEALARAQQEQKPIFLSIGYSACHWCHVMEHESFESPYIAQLMNEHFINIKVDREERPDLDQIYMQAVQLMTGRGGWPMSVFLTPDLRPFYGGTYWPPAARLGMPGFDQILNAVYEAWDLRREQALAQADELTEYLQADPLTGQAAPDAVLEKSLLVNAATILERAFDFQHGGFGGAPKFPHPMDLRLLLRVWKRESRAGVLQMATTTLDKMAAGGIYDQLGGGFHRYSVDEHWLVPHFEKMLYDNALLTQAYLEAYLATDDKNYARIVRETCDYVLRDMTDAAGGFYSTEDADSEGHEGKYYVWDLAEIEQILGADAAADFAYVYDVTAGGNFEGHNILNLPKTMAQCAQVRRRDVNELEQQLARDRAKLFTARAQRIRPGRDDKVLVSWNGFMIDALAQAAGPLQEPKYLAAAQRAADFLLLKMRDPDGRLLHVWRNGVAKQPAFVDDYASLANALVSIYEAGGSESYIAAAVQLAETMLAQFADPAGGFFFTASDHEQLIARQKDWQDSSVPSGNALAATALIRLGKLTGRADFADAAFGTMRTALPMLEKSPIAAGQMLVAVDFAVGPTPELVWLVPGKSLEQDVIAPHLHQGFVPNRVVARRFSEADHVAALDAVFAGKPVTTEPTLYICENFACAVPVAGIAAISARLGQM